MHFEQQERAADTVNFHAWLARRQVASVVNQCDVTDRQADTHEAGAETLAVDSASCGNDMEAEIRAGECAFVAEPHEITPAASVQIDWQAVPAKTIAQQKTRSLRAAIKRIEQQPAAVRPAFSLVTAENVEQLQDSQAQFELARAKAARMLARRQLSTRELQRQLEQEQILTETAQQVVEQFVAAKYLDDYALAEAIVAKHSSGKGVSVQALRRKMLQRMLPTNAIDHAIAQVDADQEAQLLQRAALERASQLSGLEPHVAKRRLLAYLARRGWSGAAALNATNQALAETTKI